MEFCPKCGSILEEKRKNYGCVRCGYTAKGRVKIVSEDKIVQVKEIGVVKEKETDVFPIVRIVLNVNTKKHISGLLKLVQEMKLKLDFSVALNVNILGENINK